MAASCLASLQYICSGALLAMVLGTSLTAALEHCKCPASTCNLLSAVALVFTFCHSAVSSSCSVVWAARVSAEGWQVLLSASGGSFPKIPSKAKQCSNVQGAQQVQELCAVCSVLMRCCW